MPLPLSPAGCARCLPSADPNAAWDALRANTLRVLVQESHLSVRLTRCACGTTFAVVFTERVDWLRGEDHQTWRALPLEPAEVEGLSAVASVDGLLVSLTELGRARHHLARQFPREGAMQVTWHLGSFVIDPHD